LSSEEALDSSHEGVERGAGVALPEVGGGETADETIDAKNAHGLVAEAEARGRVAPHDEAQSPHNLAMLVDGENAGPERLAGAACEDAEVVGVLKVLGKHDVAEVEEGC
jgi:hypothetical protein